MTSMRWTGVGTTLIRAALLAVTLSTAACGSDAESASPGAAGSASAGGSPSVGAGGEGAADGGEPASEGGAPSPVTPGELVCKSDADCATRDKPVCDQVLGCVACQYDWDCPAGHRCDDNECFQKQPCETSDDCTRDARRRVCDAVQQLCVGCREDADCGEEERCEASECVAFEACTNSRDCAGGKVCSRAAGACVGCVVDGDCGPGSACVESACVPTCESDKDCLGIGRLCDQEASRCVECLQDADCPGQYFCAESGRCVLDACEQGQSRCDGESVLATCSPSGDSFVAASCAGNERCVEVDERAAACAPLACVPGEGTCSDDATAVELCSADGLKVESSTPCGQGKTCASGACVDLVCTPSTHSCSDNKLYVCNPSGTSSVLVVACGNYYTCDAEAADCLPKECEEGEPVCEGNVATVCAPDGLGGQPGGEDCGASDACYAGECLPKVCSGSFTCDEARLHSCRNNGTLLRFERDCGAASLCDALAGKCLTPVCTPGAFVCQGNVATRCKVDGSGYETGVDCSLTNEVCDGGGCLAKSCTPGAVTCAGGSPIQCGSSGATYDQTDTCAASEWCKEGVSYCQSDKCVAGAAVCNGNFATTCASDGSGPSPGGTDCSVTQQVCEAGSCKAAICTPGAKTCQGEAVYTCNPTGTGTSLYETCSASTFCEASTGSAQCTTDVCTAGKLGCDGEQIATCASNGGSFTNPGTDCKASNQVCVLGGTCAAEEVSTQGSTSYTTSSYSGAIYLSGFRALKSRKLTKLEAYGSWSGLQKVTWVVYEKSGADPTWRLVYQKVTAQKMPTPGYFSSPALDYTLLKGKTYAVGVQVTGTFYVGYAYYGGTSYLAKASFLTDSQSLSTSGYANYTQPPASASFSSDYYSTYFVRFTTAVAP